FSYSDCKSDDEKKKRPRTAFTAAQIKSLEAEFEKNKYLSVAKRCQLSKTLKLTETQGVSGRGFFNNYSGQPGISTAPPMLPNLLPVPPSAPLMSGGPQMPVGSHSGSRTYVRNYVEYPPIAESPTEPPPIMQLQNFGRHFDSNS
ncbi:hypothetical protein NQ317_011321, partial [Molorchus minor]